jgi:hypothetical protein
MAHATDRFTGGSIEIDPESVVRMWKPIEGDAHTTAIMLRFREIVFVEESMKTMWARFGGDAVTQFFDDPRSSFESVVAIRKIAALTKLSEDSSGDDPTIIHLTNGETVPATESIRTLSARLRNAGIGTVDIDIVGTTRPACVVADHVLWAHDPLIRPHPDVQSTVYVLGGSSFKCADAPERLRREIEEARTSGADRGEIQDREADPFSP